MKKSFIIILIVFLSLLLAYNNLSRVSKQNYKFIASDAVFLNDADVLLLGSSTIAYFNDYRVFECDTVMNRGIGNSHLTDLHRYISSLKRKLAIRHVVIYAGENDLFRDVSVQEAAAIYQDSVKMILEKSPETTIHMLGVKYSPARVDAWPLFSEFNVFLNEMAESYSQVLFYPPPDRMPRQQLFKADGIHFNEVGESVFFNQVASLCNQNKYD